jgi:hypothetical protein
MKIAETIYTPFQKGHIFFTHLTDFSYFPLKQILTVAGCSQIRSKMTFLKGSVDGFSNFHYNESLLRIKMFEYKFIWLQSCSDESILGIKVE